MATVVQRIVQAGFAALCSAAVLAIGNAQTVNPSSTIAGAFTTPEHGRNALSVPVAGLNKDQAETWAAGRAQFNEVWVIAPDPSGVWGLGPTFNEDGCARCHVGNGGARAPDAGHDAELGLVVRLSISGQTKEGAPQPHPAYGAQFQNRGTPGRVPAEGRVVVDYSSREVSLTDGERVILRVPTLRFEDLQFGEVGPDIMTSPRIAPALIGLGLLEAVPEAAILQLSAQQTPDVRGKPNYVWDYENGQTVLGRFGWKANQPSVRQQTAAAFLEDIGATSSIFGDQNCPVAQQACAKVPTAKKCFGEACSGRYRPEVTAGRLTSITLYLQLLAIPARRNPADADVTRGEVLFANAKCNACHVADLRTGDKAAIAAAANITFHPFTDLLLHDMGEGLADGRPDFHASGREWRTAPLWGIGLVRIINGHTDLLHDGRARDVTEAILWHAGQAAKSREAFRTMAKEERDALVKFVESF